MIRCGDQEQPKEEEEEFFVPTLQMSHAQQEVAILLWRLGGGNLFWRHTPEDCVAKATC